MKQPPRLIDESAPEEVRLIRTAMEEEPPDGWKRSARVALGIGSGLAVGTVTTAATAKGVWSFGSRLFLAGLTSTIVAGSIAYWHSRRPSSGQDVRASDGANALAQPARPIESATSERAAPERPIANPVGPSASEAPAEAPQRGAGKARGAESRASSLGQQIARLDEVRRLLSNHEPHAAKALLDSFAKDFSRPALGPEAKVLEVQTLVDLGERDRAAVVAHDFLRAHPTSPHARQLEALIGAAPPTN